MTMSRVTGVECPDCGCPQAELQWTGTSWGKPVKRLRCTACGTAWTWPAEPEEARGPIAYARTLCPACGSKATKVASTRKGRHGMPTVRHHRCDDCGKRFKSTERRHA